MVVPKELESKLKREAAEKGMKGDRAAAYVYGTMQKSTPAWKTDRKKK